MKKFDLYASQRAIDVSKLLSSGANPLLDSLAGACERTLALVVGILRQLVRRTKGCYTLNISGSRSICLGAWRSTSQTAFQQRYHGRILMNATGIKARPKMCSMAFGVEVKAA